MNTLTVGDIVNAIDRLLRTENLPIDLADKIAFVREVVADLTATEDILIEEITIETNTSNRKYILPPEVKYVVGVWLRDEEGRYIELAPVPVRMTENASINVVSNTYSVLERELTLQRFPFVSHPQGLLVKAIITHPNILSMGDLSADTLLPRVYLRLAAVMTTRRILESFLGDEAMGWIQALMQEEEMLRQRLPKATGRYGGVGMERFTYASRGIKQAVG